MRLPLDPPKDSDEPDDPQEEEGRCNTRALDLGAVRAIHRAAQGAGAPVTVADTRPAELVHEQEAIRQEPAPIRVAPAPASPRPPAPITHIPRREMPSSVTVEVDYSPASRQQRHRSAHVQRIARAVVLGTVVAALALGMWAVFFAKRGGAPVTDGRIDLSSGMAEPARSSVAAESPASNAPAMTGTATVGEPAPGSSANAVATNVPTPARTPPVFTAPRAPRGATPRPPARPTATSDFPNQ